MTINPTEEPFGQGSTDGSGGMTRRQFLAGSAGVAAAAALVAACVPSVSNPEKQGYRPEPAFKDANAYVAENYAGVYDSVSTVVRHAYSVAYGEDFVSSEQFPSGDLFMFIPLPPAKHQDNPDGSAWKMSFTPEGINPKPKNVPGVTENFQDRGFGLWVQRIEDTGSHTQAFISDRTPLSKYITHMNGLGGSGVRVTELGNFPQMTSPDGSHSAPIAVPIVIIPASEGMLVDTLVMYVPNSVLTQIVPGGIQNPGFRYEVVEPEYQ